VLSTAAAFSFYPTKNLGACGDAGMLVTDDGELARHVRRLRVHGMEETYIHQEVGLNSRLDALQAAVLSAKLPFLEGWIRARQRNAARYAELFARYDLLEMVRLPVAADDRRHVFHQYVIRVEESKRDSLREHLDRHGIGSAVYYPLPLHMQPCFAKLGYKQGDFPRAEQAARSSLALPVYPELTPREQEAVVAAVGSFFGRSPRGHAVPRPNYLKRDESRVGRIPGSA
jgi:dTDP-4-amino-4,6-dideoxygalactose transaminase